MGKLSFRELEEQRQKIILRLRSLNVPDIRVHGRATVELQNRLDDWLGNAVPPLSRFVDLDPRELALPVRLCADQVELLIVHALGAGDVSGEFVRSPAGALYMIDPDNGRRVFLTGLSPLLDEATDIFRCCDPGSGVFFERDGHFITDDGTSFLIAGPQEGTISGQETPDPASKSFWQQVISLLPWVHDEPPAKPSANSRPPVDPVHHDGAETGPIYQLYVNFDAGRWPTTGVLSEMDYRVGKNGLPTASRREILRDVLHVHLVAGSTDAESYIREWGDPSSEQRIIKTYNAIAAFSRNAQRRNANYSEAIADWESDLDWLESTYGVTGY